MARFTTTLIPSSDAPIQIIGTVAGAASAKITLSKNAMFVINSDQDILITFGLAATIVSPSATYGYRIPANQQTVLDMGQANDTLMIWNLGTQNATGGQTGATASNTYIQRLSVV